MTKYPFIYKVVLFIDHEWRLDCGLGFAEDYADAAKILERDVYRNDLVSIKHLELLECSDIVSMPWEVLQQIANGDFDIPAYCDKNGEVTHPASPEEINPVGCVRE